jgi:hypothetical protein
MAGLHSERDRERIRKAGAIRKWTDAGLGVLRRERAKRFPA